MEKISKYYNKEKRAWKTILTGYGKIELEACDAECCEHGGFIIGADRELMLKKETQTIILPKIEKGLVFRFSNGAYHIPAVFTFEHGFVTNLESYTVTFIGEKNMQWIVCCPKLPEGMGWT